MLIVFFKLLYNNSLTHSHLDHVLVSATDDVLVGYGQTVDTGSLTLENMSHLQTVQVPYLHIRQSLSPAILSLF